VGWTAGVLFSTTSTPALGLTQSPVYRLPEAFSSGVTCLKREVDYSPQSSAEVKNVCGALPPLPHFMAWFDFIFMYTILLWNIP